jgi:hypothetical protein
MAMALTIVGVSRKNPINMVKNAPGAHAVIRA